MQNRQEVAMGFLLRMGDPAYRLEGENAATTNVDEARRWGATYERLIEFKKAMLHLAHRFADDSEPEVAHAIRDADIILLEMQMSRFQARRDYWKIREAELTGRKRGAA